MIDLDYDLGPLQKALTELHRRCDYAEELDGEGFSASDTHYGKALAVLPVEMWTDGMVRDAHEMLRSYRKQLTGYGVDYDEIPVPPNDEAYESGTGRTYARHEMKRIARAEQETAQRVIEWKKGSHTIRVRFPYDAQMVDLLKKSVPHAERKWEPNIKVWIVREEAATCLKALLDTCEWTIGDEVRDLIEADA
jgi:hypothetical protein